MISMKDYLLFSANGEPISDIPFSVVGLEKRQVVVPFVANDFTTRKAANWNDHAV